ncbi:uncharacterized protein LY89DRAFT_685199 [Mollisia scopiformis]|uniref:Uncharacterized protein n=1 Tax=Mollisia scopiformis TaxID=149040 RepID=A0A194X7L4_MOLSC|nr:uncharacterized protein LY89DRAFT_685199 [Mollisia scopiformis]KUJ16160.1 hypothetical protein LY89DRAFT_685199 [Mollisia scopiformis]
MQFSTLLAAAPLLLAVFSIPATAEIEIRQSSTTPINTTDLLIGACLSMGTCYYGGNQIGCLTHGCANETYLGGICSCNADVQSAIDIQAAKGQKQWPVKCPY